MRAGIAVSLVLLVSLWAGAAAGAEAKDAGKTEAPAKAEEPAKAEDAYSRARCLADGDKYLAEKKYQHALNAYSQVILKEPEAKVLGAYLGRVHALAGLKDIPKAVEWAKKTTEAYPDDLRGYQVLGELYLAENYLDPVRAEGIFRQMLELDPDSRAAHVGLARALSYLKKIEKAVVILEDWLRRHPDDKALRYKLAESHFALADLDQAEEELASLLDREPDHAQARKLMETIRSRKRWALYLPLAALLLIPLMVFGFRYLKRGRIPKETD